MTQVSVEGLKKVKQALQDFKNQAAPMSYTVMNHNQSCQSDASKAVDKTRQTVEELTQRVKALENKIRELEQSIQQSERMIQELELQGQEAHETIGTLEQRAAKIQEELRKIGNVSTSDENGQSQIAQRIRQLKEELQRCREQISQLQNAVREMEQEKARLQQQEEWQRSQKARAEQEHLRRSVCTKI